MATEVFVHKMSEHMEEATIVRWLVAEGDPVEKFQRIVEIETDKATVELESPDSGVLKAIGPHAGAGAVVKVGETIAYITAPDEEPPPFSVPAGESAPAKSDAAKRPVAAAAPPPSDEPSGSRATPRARSAARRLSIDLASVVGTGPGGRITHEDVEALAAAGDRSAAAGAPPAAGDRWIELTAAQRLTGERMCESVAAAPQFSLSLRADVTDLLRLRETLTERIVAATGEKPSVTAMLVKIVARALGAHPLANATFDNGRIRTYQAVHINIAAATPVGLVAPVIRNAGEISLAEVVTQLKAIRQKAQQMRFLPSDFDGGTFTLSNLGMYAVEEFKAILNPPQSAILAVGAIVHTPVGSPDSSIAVRPLMHLTVTADHRVMDGLLAAQFLAAVKNLIERPSCFP